MDSIEFTIVLIMALSRAIVFYAAIFFTWLTIKASDDKDIVKLIAVTSMFNLLAFMNIVDILAEKLS